MNIGWPFRNPGINYVCTSSTIRWLNEITAEMLPLNRLPRGILSTGNCRDTYTSDLVSMVMLRRKRETQCEPSDIVLCFPQNAAAEVKTEYVVFCALVNWALLVVFFVCSESWAASLNRMDTGHLCPVMRKYFHIWYVKTCPQHYGCCFISRHYQGFAKFTCFRRCVWVALDMKRPGSDKIKQQQAVASVWCT